MPRGPRTCRLSRCGPLASTLSLEQFGSWPLGSSMLSSSRSKDALFIQAHAGPPRSRKPPGRRAAIRHRGWTLLTSTVDFQMPTASAVGPGARGRPPANVNRSGDTPDYSLRYSQHARCQQRPVFDRNQEPHDRRNRHPDLGGNDRSGEERCRAPITSVVWRTSSAMDRR